MRDRKNRKGKEVNHAYLPGVRQRKLPFTNSTISVDGRIGGGFDSPGGRFSGGGAALQLVEYCQFCGGRIAEQCEICRHLHPLGFEFCQTTGTNRAKFLAEKVAEEEIRNEFNRQQNESAAQKNAHKEWIRQSFNDAYQTQSKQKRFLIFFLLLGACAVSITCGILGWIHFHSTLGRIVIAFLAIGGWAAGMNLIIHYVIILPTRIAAWGPRSSWPDPSDRLGLL